MLEIETKYAVPDGYAVPPLDGDGATVDAPETVEQVAVYHDTADLRLARAATTLRRRTGGKDAGWHLKLPASGGRQELGAPLGRAGRVPAALSDLVLVRTRGQALVPVAELRTTRVVHLVRDASGQPVVEVVDDTVRASRVAVGGREATTSTWREVEAELVPGAGEDALARVDGLLRAAGATTAAWPSKLKQALGDVPGPEVPEPAEHVRGKDPARDAVAAYLRLQVVALLTQDPRVRRDEPDAVHKMRVATRRLRSALRTFAPLLQPAAIDGLDAELRWVAEVLGVARDREVLLARLVSHLDALPVQLVVGPVREELDEALAQGLAAAQDDARAALRGERYLALVDRLVDLAVDPPTTPDADARASRALPPLVRRAFRRLETTLDGALVVPDVAEREEALHDARKAAKRARYAAEAVTVVFGEPAAALGVHVTAVQEVLGEHQDATVARQLLRDLAPASRAGFTLGVLHAGEDAAAAAAREHVVPVWAHARRRRHRRWLDG